MPGAKNRMFWQRQSPLQIQQASRQRQFPRASFDANFPKRSNADLSCIRWVYNEVSDKNREFRRSSCEPEEGMRVNEMLH